VPDTFIIDGYNVIRLLLSPAEIERGFEQAREILEARIRAFRRASGPGVRIHLVYDGEAGHAARASREKGFEVHFSRPPRKADDLVLDLARKHEGLRGLHVVTSDFKDIASNLRGLRLTHLTARDFAEQVKKRLGRAAPGSSQRAADDAGKPGSPSPDEVEAWTREFGFGGGPEPGV